MATRTDGDTSGPSTSSAAAAGALAAATLAFVSAWLLRRFVVDDAWIPARYADHLAEGAGYRFNVGGAVTDGVTPLLWAPLLALFHAAGAPSLTAARVISAASMIGAAALVGAHVGRLEGARLRLLPLITFVAAPVGAWAVGGLETGLVVLAVAAGITARGAAGRITCLGLAAALRPECLPMVVVLAIDTPAPTVPPSAGPAWPRTALLSACAAALPFVIVAVVRLACFGRVVPLSAIAKPADMRYGAPYVIAGLLLLGTPAFIVAPRAVATDGRTRLYVAAVAVHALAVAWAGGDWMPLSRLLLPALPPLVIAGARVAARATSVATFVRASACALAIGFAWWTGGRAAMADIDGDRRALIGAGRRVLAGRSVVAALDIGWVSGAFSGPIVDLAGLTDPAIAVLPGGHTSKPVPVGFLDDRHVDTLVFLRRRGCTGDCVRSDGGPFERAVEERLANESWVADHFTQRATIAAGPLVYAILVRRRAP